LINADSTEKIGVLYSQLKRYKYFERNFDAGSNF
jgi:hypothetical protein